MLSLHFNNVNCYVKGPAEEMSYISKLLTWSDRGARFTKQYKGKKWDGKRTLWSAKFSMFPTGLIDAVVIHLRKKKIQVQIEDKRVKPLVDCKEIITEFELWDHQRDAVDTFLASNGRGIIKLATRSGKTVIAGAIIQTLNLPALFVAPGKDIMHQARKEFLRFGLDVGRIGDNYFETDRQVTVGIINSLSKRRNDLKDFYKRQQLLVIDECHLSSKSYQSISRMMGNAYYRLGLSATPLDGDKGQKLKTTAITGPIVFTVNTEEMIEKGRLTKPKVFFIRNESKVEDWEDWDDEYFAGIVANRKRNLMIAIASVKIAIKQKKSVLVLIQSLEHGEGLLRLLREKRKDLVIDYVSGIHSSDQRTEALYKLQTGETSILIASNIFNQGVDIPLLDAVIIAGGFKGEILTKQRIGRPITQAGDKQIALIVDFMDYNGRWLPRHSSRRLQACKKDSAFDVELIDLKEL